ncbi:MAG: VanW family protein [Verrucomicrobiales bacterium]|nr:VanW family protein [Verrucomicrobiales bacterium]
MTSIRAWIPYRIKVALVRVARWLGCARKWSASSKRRGDAEEYPIVFAEHGTPLRRGNETDAVLQEGKEKNLAIAASRTNAIVIEPGETFSYHALVGWPTKLRGFRKGLELQNGELGSGIGGGCCALSNLLYLIALQSGMEIAERHRHGLDLFPDHGRTIPFGCGATVFFPYADLKFTNPHSFPVLIETVLRGGRLKGRVRVATNPGFSFEIEERDHRFQKEDSAWFRENRIVRIRRSEDGSILDETEVAHNQGRCLYDPESV